MGTDLGFGRLPEGTGASADADQALVSDQAASRLAPTGFDPSRIAAAKCVEIARRVRDEFLSEEYAKGQPLSSLCERFACDRVIEAIESEFAIASAALVKA